MAPEALTGEAHFYSSFTETEEAALLGEGRKKRFSAGTPLFHEGDASDWLAFVLQGRVKASYYTEDGREVVLAILDPGDLIGELSALDGEPRSATVTAMEEVEALILTAGAFRHFLETQPRVAVNLVVSLTRKLRDADRKRVEFGVYDSVGRVARRLVELAERFGEPGADGITIGVPLSQQELAGWTGSSREAVAKALQTLRGLGWVETRRRQFVVKDLDALRRRAS